MTMKCLVRGALPNLFELDVNDRKSPMGIPNIYRTEHFIFLKNIELFAPSLHIAVIVLTSFTIQKFIDEERVEEVGRTTI